VALSGPLLGLFVLDFWDSGEIGVLSGLPSLDLGIFVSFSIPEEASATILPLSI